MNTLWLLTLMYFHEGKLTMKELKYYPDPISCTAGKEVAERNMKDIAGFHGLYCLPAEKEEA